MVNQRRQQPRRRSGVRVLAVVVALAIGGGGGGVAGTALAGTAFAGALGGSTAPTEPPALPAEFPDASSQSYLPDVTVSAIETWATSKDYECDEHTARDFAGMETTPGGAKHWLECHLPRRFGSARAEVSVEYDDDAEVVAVHATCERGVGTPDDFCASLARKTARTVFKGQPEVRKNAANWAKDNARNDTVTVIGGMQLKADLGNHRLTIVPES